MRYRPFIQKRLYTFNAMGKIVFGVLKYIYGEERSRVLKQKIKLILKEIPAPAVTSLTERNIFEKLKNEMEVVFDVGIQNELSFYKIKPDCTYHLFEPNQKFIRLLKGQIAEFKNHRIILNEYGLSDKPQDNCVYYEESESFIINPVYKASEADTGIRYSLRTIDGYVKKNGIKKIDFLKIDTEGFDYKILVGGMKTIRAGKISFIQFEYWKNLRQFIDLLRQNYEMYLMMEPLLLKFIEEKLSSEFTAAEKNIDFRNTLIPLNEELINMIDKKVIPHGAGGNIFCINKKRTDIDVKKLISKIN